jgi:hypothetical protein
MHADACLCATLSLLDNTSSSGVSASAMVGICTMQGRNYLCILAMADFSSKKRAPPPRRHA